jgi:hypothetical protein
MEVKSCVFNKTSGIAVWFPSYTFYNVTRGKWWCSWLRHYATSRKVAVSNPDEVIGFF